MFYRYKLESSIRLCIEVPHFSWNFILDDDIDLVFVKSGDILWRYTTSLDDFVEKRSFISKRNNYRYQVLCLFETVKSDSDRAV